MRILILFCALVGATIQPAYAQNLDLSIEARLVSAPPPTRTSPFQVDLIVRNLGTEPATGIEIWSWVTNDSTYPFFPTAGNCDFSSFDFLVSRVIYDVPDIAPNESFTCTTTLQDLADNEPRNFFELEYQVYGDPAPDSNPTDNAYSLQIPVGNVFAIPTLSVSGLLLLVFAMVFFARQRQQKIFQSRTSRSAS